MITEKSKEINRQVEYSDTSYKITANVTDNSDSTFNHAYGDVHPLGADSTIASFSINDGTGINLPSERTAEEIASISQSIAAFKSELMATYN